MIIEQPCTDLIRAKQNRERIERMRKTEGKHYTFTDADEVIIKNPHRKVGGKWNK